MKSQAQEGRETYGVGRKDKKETNVKYLLSVRHYADCFAFRVLILGHLKGKAWKE